MSAESDTSTEHATRTPRHAPATGAVPLEQVVYTRVESRTNADYQILAASPGAYALASRTEFEEFFTNLAGQPDQLERFQRAWFFAPCGSAFAAGAIRVSPRTDRFGRGGILNFHIALARRSVWLGHDVDPAPVLAALPFVDREPERLAPLAWPARSASAGEARPPTIDALLTDALARALAHDPSAAALVVAPRTPAPGEGAAEPLSHTLAPGEKSGVDALDAGTTPIERFVLRVFDALAPDARFLVPWLTHSFRPEVSRRRFRLIGFVTDHGVRAPGRGWRVFAPSARQASAAAAAPASGANGAPAGAAAATSPAASPEAVPPEPDLAVATLRAYVGLRGRQESGPSPAIASQAPGFFAAHRRFTIGALLLAGVVVLGLVVGLFASGDDPGGPVNRTSPRPDTGAPERGNAGAANRAPGQHPPDAGRAPAAAPMPRTLDEFVARWRAADFQRAPLTSPEKRAAFLAYADALCAWVRERYVRPGTLGAAWPSRLRQLCLLASLRRLTLEPAEVRARVRLEVEWRFQVQARALDRFGDASVTFWLAGLEPGSRAAPAPMVAQLTADFPRPRGPREPLARRWEFTLAQREFAPVGLAARGRVLIDRSDRAARAIAASQAPYTSLLDALDHPRDLIVFQAERQRVIEARLLSLRVGAPALAGNPGYCFPPAHTALGPVPPR